MSGQNSFLLRVHCSTYNQRAFIIDALDGFAMQQTDFPFVCTIMDDASTDGEQEVIKKYLEDNFDLQDGAVAYEKETESSHTIFAQHKTNRNCYFAVICLKENLYRKSKPRWPYLVEWRDTKYIALCEGDDYWIDPLKLQKQVDFLEAHEDYSMCFTNCFVEKGGKRRPGIVTVWDTYTTVDMLLHNSLDLKKRGDLVVSPGHTSTVLYRNPPEPIPAWKSKCFIGDEPLFIILSQYGKAKFINEATSVYRQNVGVSSKDFSFEKDNVNRVKMYQIIDEGLGFKYHRLISSKIISRYYKKLTRIAWGEKHYVRSAGYFAQFLRSKIA